jgi:hypothetical protein
LSNSDTLSAAYGFEKSAANLQTDSKQNQAALKLGVKLVIRTAAKHALVRRCEPFHGPLLLKS